MALTKNIIIERKYYSPYSVEDFVVQKKELPNAYIKIKCLEGDKKEVKLTVCIYDAKDMHTIETKSYKFTPTLGEESKNFLNQGYEYLKTLPEFADAVDC